MSKRQWWQKPIIRTDEDESRHRKVTWLELFFDLVFVVTIGQLAHKLAGDVSLEGVMKFLLLFVPVWWVWIGVTYYNERFETEGLENRAYTFLLMIPVAGLAVFAHHGLGDTYAGYALSYALARAITTFMWIRATVHNKTFRSSGIRFCTGFTLSVILVVISIFISPPLNFAVFGFALFVDVFTPFTTIKQHTVLPKFSTSKLPERFGLFTIIVLGESIIAVVNALADEHHFTGTIAAVGILGIALGFSLWWVYFDSVGRRPFKHSLLAPFFWSYLHMPLVMCITMVGAGVLDAVDSNGAGVVPMNFKMLLSFSVAGFLIITGLLEFTLRRDKDEPMDPLISPLLKITAGILAGVYGFIDIPVSSIVLLSTLLIFLLVQMIYGAVVWFRQELPE